MGKLQLLHVIISYNAITLFQSLDVYFMGKLKVLHVIISYNAIASISVRTRCSLGNLQVLYVILSWNQRIGCVFIHPTLSASDSSHTAIFKPSFDVRK